MKADRERNALALAVLAQADQRLDGWSCQRSTDCCRPALSGREPYLTEAEWLLIEVELARQGRKTPVDRGDGSCALLSEDGRCTVYTVRPLGCRSYFCDRAHTAGPFPRADLRALVRDLEALSPHGERGRPLRSWLKEAARRL